MTGVLVFWIAKKLFRREAPAWIAYILYLSETFSKNDGGALVFLNSKKGHPYKKAVSYPPVKNSMMIFEVSPKSWHEIGEVTSEKKRYTIGGWLH